MKTSNSSISLTSAKIPNFEAQKGVPNCLSKVDSAAAASTPTMRTIRAYSNTEKVSISFEPKRERERAANLIANQGSISVSTGSTDEE